MKLVLNEDGKKYFEHRIKQKKIALEKMKECSESVKRWGGDNSKVIKSTTFEIKRCESIVSGSYELMPELSECLKLFDFCLMNGFTDIPKMFCDDFDAMIKMCEDAGGNKNGRIY